MTGLVVVVVVLAAGTVFGVVRRRRSGRVRDTAVGRRAGERVTAEEIGTPLGERATLLQFSSAFCAPCRATRRILADVAGTVDGVRHVEVDAESNLSLVRRLNVIKTPTTLVLDGQGRVVRRAAGQPRKPDVVAALAEVG